MKENQKTELLSKVKTRLKLNDASVDVLLNELIEEVGYRILHYCRREDIPKELELIWLRMVLEAYIKETSASAQQEGTYVSTVSEGGTTVSYSQYSNSTATSTSNLLDDIVLNYKIDLMRYRKLSGLR